MNEPEFYLPINARSMSFRWRGAAYDISIDGQFLTTTVASGAFRTIRKTPLSSLAEEIAVDTPRSSKLPFHAARFAYAFIAALILQFSVVPRFVPYLAPVLFAYALIHFVCAIRHATPVQQTRVFDFYGRAIVAIPHLPNLELNRKRFEDQLRDAIQRTKKVSFQYDREG